jgi:dTDP-4-dehydrorhamnose reductase
MRILILGAKGNLGGQLVKVFGSEENEVIAWDREEIDITDRDLVVKKVNDLKPAVVINAAAYNSVDKCEESDEEYNLAKKINIDGPKFLAEACLETGSILIHYSTDYVFDGENIDGYNETAEPKPISRYGKSKFYGEKKILEYSGKGLKWYLIRTSKLFGPKGRGELSKPSFFDIMLDLSRKKSVLDVVDDELSCFTYTPDLALATKKLIDDDLGFGIYHIINEGACTWYQAAREFFKVVDNNIKVNLVNGGKFPRPALRPRCSVLINTKMSKLRDYRNALKQYIEECKM